MFEVFKGEIHELFQFGSFDLPFPEIRLVEESGKMILPTAYMKIAGINHAPMKVLSRSLLIHSLLDAVLESENESFIDLTFQDKYQKLPASSDFEKSIRSTYRILSVLRNALTHRKDKFEQHGERIIFEYKRKGKGAPQALDIDVQRLNFLLAVAYLRARMGSSVDRYHQFMATAMYRVGVENIGQFSDTRISEDKLFNGGGYRVGLNHRYRVKIPNVRKDGADRYLIERKLISDYEKAFAGSEYELTIGREVFLVPDEILGEGGSIDGEDLKSWRKTMDIFSTLS